jgi:dodecin
MSTYKMIRLVGTSPRSYEDAVQNAVTDAHDTIRGLNWFSVIEQRGRIDDSGKIVEWQVVIEVAFKILRS